MIKIAPNTAPMIPDEDTATALMELWREHFLGRNKDFYEFITTPSPDRLRLIAMCKKQLIRKGATNAVILSV